MTPEEVQRRLDRILPTIQKPGRYTGGEYNQVVKDWSKTPTRVVLAFPDIYDLGMSLSSPSESESSDGGYIELRVRPTQAGLWTIVQWQDDQGDWHDIEGWQGTLDEGSKKVWWVDPGAFGKGPFRWVIYQGQQGRQLAQSKPFYLPHAGETVKIETSPVPSQPTSITSSISTLPSLSSDGGYIELRVRPTQAGLWTIVQWQDDQGDWHDIEGWQGTLDEGSKKVWWVDPGAFGEGPFRWVIYQGQQGRQLAQSEPFYLPHAGEIIRIDMLLAP